MNPAATTEKNGGVPLPSPLVSPARHPFKWARNKVQLALTAVVFTYIGTLIIVALYYLLFEVNPTMNHWWHSAVSDSNLRHNIRDVAEGLLGGFLAQQIIWNHYKRSVRKKNYKPITMKKLAIAPIKGVLFAIPGFIAGYFIVKGFHDAHQHLRTIIATPANLSHSNLFVKSEAAWTNAWPQKVIGIGASLFFGRRALRSTFDGMQRWFAERRVGLDRKVRWYHPPTFKARYNDLKLVGVSQMEDHPALENTIMLTVVAIGLGLAAYGWYILAYIAN